VFSVVKFDDDADDQVKAAVAYKDADPGNRYLQTA